MPLEQLTYTPTQNLTANEHPNTMVLLVDDEMLEKYRQDSTHLTLNQVVDSFEVFKYETPGRQGNLNRASKAELESCFGTSNADKVVEIMLREGKLHGKHNRAKKGMPQTTDNAAARLHVEHTRPL